MSRVESPAETLERFTKTDNWLEKSSLTAIAGDLLVVWAESNLEWFPDCYEERDGTLFHPQRGPVVGTDGGDPAQAEFNQELENWFLTHDSGIAVGISPKGGKFNYPDNQIQIYRIAYELVKNAEGKIIGERKALLVAFHQFDFDFKNPGEIRRFIFPEADREEAILEMIGWLKKISHKKVGPSATLTNEVINQAYSFASALKSGVDPREVFAQMTQTGFLGDNPIGCAPVNTTEGLIYTSTFSTSALSEGFQIEGERTLYCTCPNCGQKVNAIISAGRIHCPNCGATAPYAC